MRVPITTAVNGICIGNRQPADPVPGNRVKVLCQVSPGTASVQCFEKNIFVNALNRKPSCKSLLFIDKFDGAEIGICVPKNGCPCISTVYTFYDLPITANSITGPYVDNENIIYTV